MNKKQLYESIMNSVSKEVKKALLEYRTKVLDTYEINPLDIKQYLKITEQLWIYDKIRNIQGIYNEFWVWGGHGAIYVYVGSVYTDSKEPVNITITNKSGYKNIKSDLRKILEYLRAHKEFQIISSRIETEERLEFKYFIEKDKELYDKIEAAKTKFEQDIIETNTNEYVPTQRDWIKMIEYKNSHANPERVAKSCKEPRKLVARYIISKALKWGEAAAAFKDKILKDNVLTEPLLEAYKRKYLLVNIPEDYKELIDDLKLYDQTGALNQIENSDRLPNIFKKYIHDISNIKSYTIEIPEGKPLVSIRDNGKYNARVGRVIYGYTGNAKISILHITLVNDELRDFIFALRVGSDKYSLFKGDINLLRHVSCDGFMSPKLAAKKLEDLCLILF